MSAPAVLSISIDAQSSLADRPASVEALESTLIELVDRFNKRRVPATWALANLMDSPIASRLACSVRHEPALLIDARRMKSESRADIAGTIIHPVQAAARMGLSVTTLASNEPWRPQHLDLLAKYGITIIRSPRTIGLKSRIISRHRTQGLHTLCSGMWQVPMTTVLRGGGWASTTLQSMRLRRAVERVAFRGGYCHLRIDAAELASGDIPSALRAVERLLRHIEALHTAGRLTLETLRGTAERLSPKRAVAAQSILRAA